MQFSQLTFFDFEEPFTILADSQTTVEFIYWNLFPNWDYFQRDRFNETLNDFRALVVRPSSDRSPNMAQPTLLISSRRRK